MFESYSKDKSAKYLILGIIVIFLAVLFKEVLFKEKPLPVPEPFEISPRVEIDVKVLEDPEIKKLSPFNRLSFPKETGRENPFVPYNVQ